LGALKIDFIASSKFLLALSPSLYSAFMAAPFREMIGRRMHPTNSDMLQQNNSIPVKLSEIKSLTSEVQGLESSAGNWDTAYVRFAGFAVAIAVIAFFLQFVAHKKGVRLREKQAKLLALTQQVTGLQIAEANDRASAANAIAGTANERAAEANRKAEEEHLARVKLEAEIAPRRLTPQQEVVIATSLRGLSQRQRGFVRVSSYALDAEGGVLAGQITEALLAGGINVLDGIAGDMPLGGIELGIRVYGKDANAVGEISRVLRNAGGLDPISNDEPSSPNAMSNSPFNDPRISVTVLVGVKPIKK
jgi:hypothetical protein